MADAIEFCGNSLKLLQFKDCQILAFNRSTIYLLNSRIPLGDGHKAPMSPSNEDSGKSFFYKALGFHLKLTEVTSIYIYYKARNTLPLSALH